MSQYKKQKGKKNPHLAAHPQNLPALHPKLDHQLIKWHNTMVTVYHKLIITVGLSKMIKIY